jgi:hypothetical protein
MKTIILAVFYGILVILTSCEKEELSTPIENGSSGMSQSDSEIYTINSKDNAGFSIENLTIGDFPGMKPDFILIPHTNNTGDLMSPFLSNPNLENRFILTKEFDDPETAEAFYDYYNSPPLGKSFQKFALNLKENQIWLIKNNEGIFCKLLIIETTIDTINSSVEIKFEADKLGV